MYHKRPDYVIRPRDGEGGVLSKNMGKRYTANHAAGLPKQRQARTGKGVSLGLFAGRDCDPPSFFTAPDAAGAEGVPGPSFVPPTAVGTGSCRASLSAAAGTSVLESASVEEAAADVGVAAEEAACSVSAAAVAGGGAAAGGGALVLPLSCEEGCCSTGTCPSTFN